MIIFGFLAGITGKVGAQGFGVGSQDFGLGRHDKVWNAPDHSLFYDRPLLAKQYTYGTVASILGGAIGFYLGNAVEGTFWEGDSAKGYLSFTGIRYSYLTGAFWGGGAGILFGSSLTVFLMGDSDEEEGSYLWTFLGGTLTTAAGFAMADLIGVQEKESLWPFIPLIALPATGSLLGYHTSRWFNDKKRKKATEVGTVHILPPRIALAPTHKGMEWRMDAVNLSF